MKCPDLGIKQVDLGIIARKSVTIGGPLLLAGRWFDQ